MCRKVEKLSMDSDNADRPLLADAPRRDDKGRISLNFCLVSVVMLLGPLATGIAFGMSSPMIPSMKKDKSSSALKMTSSDYSWLGSLLSLGAIAGGPIGGCMIESVGRKNSAIFCGVLFVSGLLMMVFSKTVFLLLLGRTLTGVAAGIETLVVPAYMSETSPEHTRGSLVSAHQLVMNFGVLLSYTCGSFMNWRIVTILYVIPCGVWSLLSVILPKSPRFLMIKHRTSEAKASLIALRGKSADIEGEIIAMEENIRMTSNSATWWDVFTEKSIRTAVFISLALAVCRQWNGQQCVLYYSKSIFAAAGIKSEGQKTIATVGCSLSELISSFIPVALADKIGRKILLVISGMLMALGSSVFGLCVQINSSVSANNSSDLGIAANTEVSNWVMIASIWIYVGGFGMGLAPIFWLLVSEIIPPRAKGKGDSLASSANWAFGFLVTKEFFEMERRITLQGTFWLFSLTSIIGVIFYWFSIPKTRGKTLEEISMDFERVETQGS